MDTAHIVTREEVKGIVSEALRQHEQSCYTQRQEMEQRLGTKIDQLEEKINGLAKMMYMYAGGLTVLVFLIEYFK